MTADQAELGATAVRLLEMEADDLVLALGPGVEPPGQALVQVCSHLLGDAVVRHLLNQHVCEPEGVLDRRRSRIRLDQLSADERHQMLAETGALVVGEEGSDRAPAEVPAFDRGPFEHGALRGLEAGDSRGEHRLDAGGQDRRLAAFFVGCDELLEEQRVALGGPDDPGGLERPQLARAERVDELPRVGLGQGRQRHQRPVLVLDGP